MTYLSATVVLVLGLLLGEWFPDIDQRTTLLLHRSSLTHGPLLPLTVFGLVGRARIASPRWFSLGISLGVTAHLAFDLFPKAWYGYALVSVPIFGWLPAPVSWVWIGGSMLLCSYLAGRVVRSPGEAAVYLAAVWGLFAYLTIEETVLWRPLAALAGSTLLAGLALVLTPQRTPSAYN